MHPLQLYTWNQHQLLETQSSASKCICSCLFPWFGVISTHDWAKYLCVGNFATEPLYPEQADTLQPGWREVVDEILGSDFRNLGIKGQPMRPTGIWWRLLVVLPGKAGWSKMRWDDMPWCPVTRCDMMWHDLIWYETFFDRIMADDPMVG